MNIKTLINWKLYFLLLAASVISIFAVMPYVLTIQGEVLKTLPMSLTLVVLISVIQSAVLFAILLFIGLRLSKKLGLQIPILESYIAKKRVDVNVKSIIKISVLLGVLSGIAIVLFDFFFTKLGVNLMGQAPVPVWQGFLASFYGGISEEIVMRLFFMTFVVWLVSKLIRPKGKVVENNLVMWSAIILAALLFGIGHLPVTSALTTLTPLVIFRALLLNGIGGVVFGWLYWKKGLESAMIAHFSADIILHVLLPLILLF
ncbi:CPBP family intramembrane metalloprotease [bacterium]|nr:CPBP family intramembrane metalloprotease [bacterium]